MDRKRASFKNHSTTQKLKLTDYQTKLAEKLNSVNEPTLKPDDYDNLASAFHKNDPDEDFTVPFPRLANLMSDASRTTIPTYELREIAKSKGVSDITPEDFVVLYVEDQKRAAIANLGFRTGLSRVCSRKNVKIFKKEDQEKLHNKVAEKLGTEDNALKSVHTYSVDEVRGFSSWINNQLKNGPVNKNAKIDRIPIDESDPNSFFEKLGDGVVLCLMLQKVGENLIDDRAINFKITHPIHKHENLNIAINTAASIGCVTTNQDPSFIIEGRPNMCCGLTWQIIRAQLMTKISLNENPYLMCLAREGETIEDLRKLSPEELLLRWVNYQLEQNENYEGGPISNFSRDIKDSVAYQYLIEQIQPKNTGLVANPSDSDLHDRAENTLQMADRIDCREFVTPADIVKGQPRLNLAFVANLFNNHPNLKPMEVDEIIETREEKTYRNWMNSLGIKPSINYLYTDLQNGVALLKIEDRIQPGIIDWRRVNMPPYKSFGGLMKRTENCTYAVDTAPSLKIKVIGMRGHDIAEGNKTLTLGIVWQLMRAYTLSLLNELGGEGNKLSDRDIVNWFNAKTGSSINSFKNSGLEDSLKFQALLRAIDPSVEMEDLKVASSYCEKVSNANYVINIARRMGAVVYTLPEDIAECSRTESSKKMVLCFVITLMVLEKQLEKVES
jgi:hypothetical protein